MAYVVVNSRYNPFTFDELIKPYTMYETAYREQEAALDAAREKEFTDSLDMNLDKQAYDMYNTATTGLKEVSDELATKGLSPELRSRIRTTARDYKSTMSTLTSAQEKLDKERERRLKNGPDYVYQQNDLRIGDFLNGAIPNQRGESLTDITKDMSAEFGARAAQISEDTWNRAFGSNGKVIGGYYDLTTTSGLSAAQLDTILSDADTWNSIMEDSNISNDQKRRLQSFRNVIESKRKAIDYDKYDDGDRSRIDEAIAIGAHAGLGTTKHDYKVDHGYDPLSWTKYNDAKAQRVQELRLKYPQYQFDDNGNVKTDENGNLLITEVDGKPYTQDKSGRWHHPNGTLVSGSEDNNGGSRTEQPKGPKIGNIKVSKNGHKSPITAATASTFAGRSLVTNGESIGYYKEIKGKETFTPLNGVQLGALADQVGVSRAENPVIILDKAKEKGFDVLISENGEMLIRGIGSQSVERVDNGDGNYPQFDDDAAPKIEQ